LIDAAAACCEIQKAAIDIKSTNGRFVLHSCRPIIRMLHSLSNVCFGEAAGGAVELSQGPLWAVLGAPSMKVFAPAKLLISPKFG
jgi:hypothetical protein